MGHRSLQATIFRETESGGGKGERVDKLFIDTPLDPKEAPTRMDSIPRQAPGSGSPSGWTLYRATLLLVSFTVLLTTPIGNPANSVWHHLVQGRSLFGASSAFDPGWLFGLLLFLSHKASGDVGLVVLRAVCHGLWLAGVAWYVGTYGRRTSQGWLAFVFALIVLLSFEHAFDLDSAAATLPVAILLLALLETDGKVRWLLPTLTILWVNLDASGLPIIVLIYGANAVEILVARLRGDPVDDRRQQHLASLALGLGAIFATPQGIAIAEWMLPQEGVWSAAQAPSSEFGHGFRIDIGPDSIDPESVGRILAGIGAVALLGSLAGRRLRASHAVLAGGCALLVATGGRCTPSLMVLLLPLIVDYGRPWSTTWRLVGFRRYPTTAIVVMLALTAPYFLLLHRWHGGGLEFPLAAADLPRGTATFLAGQEGPFELMSPPAEVDFWRWTLRVPELRATKALVADGASSPAAFELGSAFVDEEALRRYLILHSPEYISVPLDASTFPALLAAHPQYRPLFFDDASVLYADGRNRPVPVAQYGLRLADPLVLPDLLVAEVPVERRQQLRAELDSLYRIDPRIAQVAGTLAVLDVLDGVPTTALERLQQPLAEQGARQALLQEAQGNALRALGDLKGALRSHRRAVDIAKEGPALRSAQRALATSLLLVGDHQGAFRALEGAVGRFNPEARASDLVTLAELGAAAGHPAVARTYLDFATLQLSPVDSTATDLTRRIELARRALEVSR
jgi:hypothetical protein